MQKITYYLSNGQKKELLVRRSRILIAVPAPDDVGDPLAFARGCLADVEPGWVRAAKESAVWVDLENRPPGGLTERIGPILPTRNRPDVACLRVAVVLISLSLDDDPRHEILRPQWPGDARHGDWRLSACPPNRKSQI